MAKGLVLAKRAAPRRALKALLKLRTSLALRSEFRADRRRYAEYCLPGEVSRSLVPPKNLEAQLIKDYHRIEKGLALPQPKRPFGVAVAERLEGNLAVIEPVDTLKVVGHAVSAQRALTDWNANGTISDEIAPISKASPRAIADVDGFFKSRHSVRDFESRDVPEELLTWAVSLALQSPSVCNRQAWLIRFFSGDEVRKVLSYQNGNNGFSHVIPVVGLVTVDAQLFSGAGERNQPWIEGGIFSMSFVWALHALGLDSCMLNMSVGNQMAASLRVHANIPDSELIIMMIAIGYARLDHRVARSPRRAVHEVIVRGTCES